MTLGITHMWLIHVHIKSYRTRVSFFSHHSRVSSRVNASRHMYSYRTWKLNGAHRICDSWVAGTALEEEDRHVSESHYWSVASCVHVSRHMYSYRTGTALEEEDESSFLFLSSSSHVICTHTELERRAQDLRRWRRGRRRRGRDRTIDSPPPRKRAL